MVYEKVKVIEFELSTTCNSFCPACARYTSDDNGIRLNHKVDFNEHLTIENFTNIISDPCVDEYVSLDFIGTVGDPLAHPQFLEILKIATEVRPNADFNIHTNGGLKNPSYYEKLAKVLDGKQYYFQFSIDGLEDTNHIYRIGVQWNRVIDNLHAFIQAGGIPSWQMVVFPWNKHQVEEARKFAEELGCKSFDIRQNIYSADLDVLMKNAKDNFYKTETDEKTANKRILPQWEQETKDLINNYTHIDDECFSKEGIFIRPEGYVYPCCMFSAAAYDLYRQKLLEEAYFTPYEKEWNELSKHSLTDIMNNKWWTDLKQGLDNNRPCDLCINQCGVVENTARHDIETQRTNF